MNKYSVALSGLSLLLLGACSAKKQAAVAEIEVRQNLVGISDARALPLATIFRISGDYADKVAITLNPDGSLAYYPAPSDLSAASAPLYLGDGWYLNRQGIGPNSVFTSFSFSDYRTLPQAPSHGELSGSVIPGARVVEMREIPVRASDASADPSLCLPYLPQSAK